MSGNEWDEIDFGKVPAGANKKYGKMAFQNLNRNREQRSSDEKRVECAKNHVKHVKMQFEGKKGGIKGKAAGPVSAIQHYMRGGPYDESVEAMFADLVRVTKQQMSEGGKPTIMCYYFRCKWINGWCTNGSLYCTITCSSGSHT